MYKSENIIPYIMGQYTSNMSDTVKPMAIQIHIEIVKLKKTERMR